MKVLVCGSRTIPKHEYGMSVVLEGLLAHSVSNFEELLIVSGGARGADRNAECFFNGGPCAWDPSGTGRHAGHESVAHQVFPADWDTFGKSAGFIRNQQMLEQEPNLVVAFVDKPLEESRGTRNMVALARKAGVETWVVHMTPQHGAS